MRAVVGVPAAALRTNKQYLRNALKGVVDSLMIVSEPFAVAYGLNALVHTLIIDIGAGTTDFCVMKGRYPTDEDQRSLTMAGDSIDAHLHKAIQARYPKASVTLFMVREWKEQHSFVGEPPAPVVVSAPVDGVPTDLDITERNARGVRVDRCRRSSKRCSLCCRRSIPSSSTACATTSRWPAAARSSAISARRSKPRSSAWAAAR